MSQLSRKTCRTMRRCGGGAALLALLVLATPVAALDEGEAPAEPEERAELPPAPPPAAESVAESVTMEQRARIAALRVRLDSLRDGGVVPARPEAIAELERLASEVEALEAVAAVGAWRAREYAAHLAEIKARGLRLPAAVARDQHGGQSDPRPSVAIEPALALVLSEEPKATYAGFAYEPAEPIASGATLLRIGLYRASGVRLVLAWMRDRGQVITGEQDLAPIVGD